MTNNEIIEAISGDVKSIIDNMAVKTEHRDDLLQEAMVILLTYNHQKLEEIYKNKQIKFFVARILCNQYYSTHSAFFKTYKRYENNKYNIQEGYKKLNEDPN